MTVRTDMLTSRKIIHGSYAFMPATDAAFANNGRSQFTAAQHRNITFLAPGHKGCGLTAVAQERHLAWAIGDL